MLHFIRMYCKVRKKCLAPLNKYILATVRNEKHHGRKCSLTASIHDHHCLQLCLRHHLVLESDIDHALRNGLQRNNDWITCHHPRTNQAMMLRRYPTGWLAAGSDNCSKIVGRRWFPNTKWCRTTVKTKIRRTLRAVPSLHGSNVTRLLGILSAKVATPCHAGCGRVLVVRETHDVVAGTAWNARIAVEANVGAAFLAPPARPATTTNSLS